ncbi:MAG: hypothetical protein MUO78_02195 [candidate division Zixibacteria bacterium]|nr:hypothetical protein [candidate division Zixibacteria bacterium]
MRTKVYIAFSLICLLQILNLSVLSNQSFAFKLQSYPKDGNFKQLSPDRDPWYFVDEKNWYIMGPDKWQHFSGCYIAQKLFSQVTNPYLSAGVVAFLGLAKEYDDAYREGWSSRDLLMDFLGIVSAINRTKYQFYCSFDSEKMMLNLNFSLR